MLNRYFQYMGEVLGVGGVLLPKKAPEVQEKPLLDATTHLCVLFVDNKRWSAPAFELFEKMREAMKLSSEQVMVIFADELGVGEMKLKALGAQQIVSFSLEISKELSPDYEEQLSTTVSPEIMIKNPAEKKVVWAQLQEVMRRLKT